MKKLFSVLLNHLLYWIALLVKKERNLWLFGSWKGNSFSDNSRYLFEHVSEKHPEINAIWITKNRAVYRLLREKKYHVCMHNSLEGIRYGLKCHAAFVSTYKVADLYPFIPDGRTHVINLWHGIPLKKIMHDDQMYSRKYRPTLKNTLKKYLFPFYMERYSFVAATSEECRSLFMSAFNLPEDRVRITGYPRTDPLFKAADENVPPEGFRVIYMPTLRAVEDSVGALFDDHGFDPLKLQRFCEQVGIYFDMKLHPLNSPPDRLKKQIDRCDRINLLPSSLDIYDILADYSVLMVDYSSIYFDYLALNRPIIFAPFDLELYNTSERQLYYRYDEITPGRKIYNWGELEEALSDTIADESRFSRERQALRKRFHAYADPGSSERVYREARKLD